MTVRRPGDSALARMLSAAPRNWGRWGDDDEVGSLNFLTADEVLRGVASVRKGSVFPLAMRIAGPEGEALTPERRQAQRRNTQDRASYVSGAMDALEGGLEYADDTITMFLQGTTHYDGIGHAWYGGELYNGYSADETIDEMSRAGVLPIAERGVVGRATLIDIARSKGVPWLGRGEGFTLDDVLAAAAAQGSEIEPHDILLLRTGWMRCFREDRETFNTEPFIEPGLIFEPRVPEFFHELEIPVYATDTVANELQPQPGSGVMSTLHASLMRNLGVAFNEILWLEDLAADCAEDGVWQFLYAAAPLKVVGATGAPVNPIAIK